jgi:hypothetical protein
MKNKFVTIVDSLGRYFKSQTLTDFGTMLIGLSAVFAILNTDNLLDRILEVKNSSSNIHLLTLEIKNISLETRKLVIALEENLKKQKAKEIVTKDTSKKDEDKLRKEIISMPEYPNYDEEGIQYYLVGKDKKELLAKLPTFSNEDDLIQNISAKLKLFNKKGISHYRVFLSINQDKIKTLFQESPSKKPWLSSTNIKDQKIILHLRKAFPDNYKCFCILSPETSSCDIQAITKDSLILSHFEGIKVNMKLDLVCEPEDQENKFL